MVIGLLTPSQYLAMYVLGVFSIGIALAAAVARPGRVGCLDVRPTILIQVVLLLGVGVSAVLWPDYPRAGGGEYARAALWVPAACVGAVELRRAMRGRPPTLPSTFGGGWPRLGVLFVLGVIMWKVAALVDLVSTGLMVAAFGAALPLPRRPAVAGADPMPRRGVAIAVLVSLVTALSWRLSPSARTALPASATNIEETYVNWVLPPDFEYALEADVPDETAERAAEYLGLSLPAVGGRTRWESGRCEAALEWKPPRISYSEGCY